jgi:hypothetical protein
MDGSKPLSISPQELYDAIDWIVIATPRGRVRARARFKRAGNR